MLYLIKYLLSTHSKWIN